jgi:hypothetical protein
VTAACARKRCFARERGVTFDIGTAPARSVSMHAAACSRRDSGPTSYRAMCTSSTSTAPRSISSPRCPNSWCWGST